MEIPNTSMSKPRKIRIELVITSLIVVTMAIVTLFSSYGFQSVINEQQRTIQAQNSTISDLQNQISSLNANISKLKSYLLLTTFGLIFLTHQLNETNTTILILRQNLSQSQTRITNLTQIVNLRLVNNLGTKTFTIQPNPPDSPYCSYQALATFQSTYAGYMVLSGYATSSYFRIYVTYNSSFEDATSWFVASAGTSTINATVPLYPSLVTVWVLNCDNVPVSGSITVTVHW